MSVLLSCGSNFDDLISVVFFRFDEKNLETENLEQAHRNLMKRNVTITITTITDECIQINVPVLFVTGYLY